MLEQALMLGAERHENWVYFNFDTQVCDELGETLIGEAAEIESQMMQIGFDGALIGHPIDDSDWNTIKFILNV